MKKLFAIIGAVLSVFYIINPTAGVFELIPDNLPVVGNLDEAAATGLLITCLKLLGVDLIGMFTGKRGAKSDEASNVDVVDID